jgi:hypothetical protein
MPKTRRWTKIPGLYSIELLRRADGQVEDTDGDLVPGIGPEYPCIDDNYLGELTIYFTSSGECTPATYDSPADGEDIRELNYAEIEGTVLPQPLAQRLFDHFTNEIDVAGLSASRDDRPDPDRYGD